MFSREKPQSAINHSSVLPSPHDAPQPFDQAQDTNNETDQIDKPRYVLESIKANKFVELQLLLLTFSTGVQDSVSFPDFLCFASNQTGNTVILAVGLTGFRGESFHLPNIGMSLAMFLAGAIMTGQLGNMIGARQRLWQVLSNVVQTIMVFGVAWLQFEYGAKQQGPQALGAIALLAFSSGMQVAAARAFKMTEISTAMATAAWVDLVIDPHLLAIRNRSRDRRAAFLLALAAGSFAGAYMRSKASSPIALAVSAAIKGLVIPMLLISRSERPHITSPV